jgi:tRNA pseudouridine55 synthase
MQGFLVVDKSAGWTSRDAVNVVVKLCPRGTKVGHAGTLDSLATGVLVIAVGKATRLIEYAQEGAKTYVGEFLLGRTSDTEDMEGAVVEVENAPLISREAIEAVLPQFLGPIMQRPPAYSAIQVDGQRSYKRARRGEQVHLPARPVRIDSIELLDLEYPRFELRVVCGKGTYIRSLGRDIGERLGSGAVMSQLRRTCVGAFRIEDAVAVDRLRAEGVAPFLRPMQDALPLEMPRLELAGAAVKRLLSGQVVQVDASAEEVAIVAREHLLSIARRVASNLYRGEINFARPEEALDAS